MRWLALTSFILLLSNHGALVSADSGLYPPGLLPLVNKANVLLASGMFNDAAKTYSEAIEQSPADYLLFYKRATAYLSLQRHSAALEDFDKVLNLTSNTFDNAHLMKARIFAKEGHFDVARTSLSLYIKAKGKDKDAEELDAEITEGERLKKKADKERLAELWNACVESASQALRVASHSIEIRTWRAECSLAAGDIESTVGDLTRLSHLLPPSTQLLTRIFRLSFFLLPQSPAAMNALKQCLHYDPDSKYCHKLHKLGRALDKSFTKLEELLEKQDWKGVTKHLLAPEGGRTGELWRKWEEAMLEYVGREQEVLPLVPPELVHASNHAASPTSTPSAKGKGKEPTIQLPLASKVSPRRQQLVRALCKSYIHLTDISKSSKEYKAGREKWCEELLTLEGCQEDVDGLVGRGEALLAKEEYEDAVRSFERAFETSGRSDRDIHQRLQKAQKLLKQSKQKDYYKILGVPRDADDKTIKKTFRKAAKFAHPDKGGSQDKMSALNEAYEVLSDPELRQRFDNGEDPNDPMVQQGGHPFANGQHPFASFFQQGGGGFQYSSGGHGQPRGGGFHGGPGGGFQFHFNGGH